MVVSSSLLAVLVGVLAVCVIIQFGMMATMNRRWATQSKMLRQFFSGPNDEDLQALLARVLEDSHFARDTAQRAHFGMEEALGRLEGCLQHFALVRYDAFEDVTGQMSFSLAMLDGHNNGAMISTIFGRNTSRCFGKMIVAGQCEQLLSDEEQQALIQALEAKVAVKSASESAKSRTQTASNARSKATKETPSKNSPPKKGALVGSSNPL